jgi:hypothetical protein
LKAVFCDPVHDPVAFAAFNPCRLEHGVLLGSFHKVDFERPTWIVYGTDFDAPLMLPIAVTSVRIPFLEGQWHDHLGEPFWHERAARRSQLLVVSRHNTADAQAALTDAVRALALVRSATRDGRSRQTVTNDQ